jgi:hypothetical protein
VAYALAFTRLGRKPRGNALTRSSIHFSAPTRELNAELGPMLVYLTPGAAANR